MHTPTVWLNVMGWQNCSTEHPQIFEPLWTGDNIKLSKQSPDQR